MNSIMKWTFFLSMMMFVGCNDRGQSNTTTKKDTLQSSPGSTAVTEDEKADTLQSKKYSNERFRDVTVQKTAKEKFLVRGEGQIFEASFSWIVEDGHEELKKGFEMTDAGAPDWGKFEFTVDVSKKRGNSTLTLILFESSAKDGSRQHELPIPLY
jgi:hypothetical protein